MLCQPADYVLGGRPASGPTPVRNSKQYVLWKLRLLTYEFDQLSLPSPVYLRKFIANFTWNIQGVIMLFYAIYLSVFSGIYDFQGVMLSYALTRNRYYSIINFNAQLYT